MSDSFREAGGLELARHYPDRGQISDSHWYKALVQVEIEADGVGRWLRSLSVWNQSFSAVLSADADGFRILMTLEQYAATLPWSEATVFAERGEPATVVRLRTAAVPWLTLVIHLDDAAADDLFRDVVEPLPRRDPPRRLFWPKPWAALGLVLVMLATGGLIASLKLPPLYFIAMVVGAGVVLWVALIAVKPFIEDEP
jgi:hypothetical protein